MSKYKPYALVGSRETPQDVLDLMTTLVYHLCRKGYTTRSGGADGADTCAEGGYNKFASEFGHNTDLLEVFLPWRGFNGRMSKFSPYYIAPNLSKYGDAIRLAEDTHPAWDRCSRGARGLHTRNINQCLGKDLDSPVSFVICWAKPKGDDGVTVQGGTNTCVQLAHKHGAKIFNLYYPDVRTKLEKWIKEMEE